VSNPVAGRATERLWQLPWAGKTERVALTELLIHKDIPDLIAEVHRLTELVEEVKGDRALLKQVAERGGW
jgi:hypothetical protein